MNVLVINDISWDNFALVSKRINPLCINPNHRINYYYGKHMRYMVGICNQNSMCLIRRPIVQSNIKECILDSLKFTKLCIIFHNFIEYNTLSSIYINICEENKIPYFVMSEHCDKFYMNGEYISGKKFKTCVREIGFEERTLNIEIPQEIRLFEEKETYPKNIQEVVNNLRSRYQMLKDKKDAKKIVYDENLVKERKKALKSDKEISYLEFVANKKKWIKEVIPKH